MKEKKEKVTRHVYGVFLRIKEKNKNNSRIYVMELPSGQFIDGIIPTATILKVELRQIISVDLTDIHPVEDINQVVSHESYKIQPSVYPSKIDLSVLESLTQGAGQNRAVARPVLPGPFRPRSPHFQRGYILNRVIAP